MNDNVISGCVDYFVKNDSIVNGSNFYIKTEPGINITNSYKSSLDELYERIMTELTYKPIVEHKCNNCGASLTMDANDHCFKCKYCGSAYLIGTNQING